jgi:hypothetical protein
MKEMKTCSAGCHQLSLIIAIVKSNPENNKLFKVMMLVIKLNVF